MQRKNANYKQVFFYFKNKQTQQKKGEKLC